VGNSVECICQVENMASAFGKALDINIPSSVLEYENTEKAETIDWEKRAGTGFEPY